MSSYADNFQRLSLDIGKSPKYISTVFSKSVDPSLGTVIELARALGVSVEFLAGEVSDVFTVVGPRPFHHQSDEVLALLYKQVQDFAAAHGVDLGAGPSIDDLLVWWYSSDRTLEAAKAFLGYVDVYEATEVPEETISIERMGEQSLSTMILGGREVDLLKKAISEAPPHTREHFLRDYNIVAKGRPLVSIENIELVHPKTGAPLLIPYSRVLLPVIDAMSKRKILNRSKIILAAK